MHLMIMIIILNRDPGMFTSLQKQGIFETKTKTKDYELL